MTSSLQHDDSSNRQETTTSLLLEVLKGAGRNVKNDEDTAASSAEELWDAAVALLLSPDNQAWKDNTPKTLNHAKKMRHPDLPISLCGDPQLPPPPPPPTDEAEDVRQEPPPEQPVPGLTLLSSPESSPEGMVSENRKKPLRGSPKMGRCKDPSPKSSRRRVTTRRSSLSSLSSPTDSSTSGGTCKAGGGRSRSKNARDSSVSEKMSSMEGFRRTADTKTITWTTADEEEDALWPTTASTAMVNIHDNINDGSAFSNQLMPSTFADLPPRPPPTTTTPPPPLPRSRTPVASTTSRHGSTNKNKPQTNIVASSSFPPYTSSPMNNIVSVIGGSSSSSSKPPSMFLSPPTHRKLCHTRSPAASVSASVSLRTPSPQRRPQSLLQRMDTSNANHNNHGERIGRDPSHDLEGDGTATATGSGSCPRRTPSLTPSHLSLDQSLGSPRPVTTTATAAAYSNSRDHCPRRMVISPKTPTTRKTTTTSSPMTTTTTATTHMAPRTTSLASPLLPVLRKSQSLVRIPDAARDFTTSSSVDHHGGCHDGQDRRPRPNHKQASRRPARRMSASLGNI